MCIGFTDLNKCCPKDDLPIVGIDKIFDSATGYERIHSWIVSHVATKFGSAGRMRRRLVSFRCNLCKIGKKSRNRLAE
jgi:hypothetical protein